MLVKKNQFPNAIGHECYANPEQRLNSKKEHAADISGGTDFYLAAKEQYSDNSAQVPRNIDQHDSA